MGAKVGLMVKTEEHANNTYVDVSFISINFYLLGFGLYSAHQFLFLNSSDFDLKYSSYPAQYMLFFSFQMMLLYIH